jgi:hypothetical protein
VACGSLSLYVVLKFQNQLCSPQLSCFGVGFSLCLITGGLFLCLTPFLWGKVSGQSAGPLLSVCLDGLLIIFQFCNVVWVWMLLTGSGDEFCGPLLSLFQAAAYHLPAVCPSSFPAFVYWKFMQDQLLASSPFSSVLSAILSLCCVLVFGSFFLCVWGGEVILPRGLCWFILGVTGVYCMMLGAHLFGLLTISQVGLEPVSGSMAALLFSQCNMAWRSFPRARDSECQSFDCPCCFISTNCGSSVSAKFWSHRAHTVCFCALVAILDPPVSQFC